jgi:glycosyltransferase involved in cell wall biosynthesis
MRPKLAIVIPTLNEEHYLPLLLEDLSNQTKKDFEVIIVDAKSKDNTRKVADLYKKKLALTFIESSKGHVAHQRNLGAAKAKSSYVFFIDADTRIDVDVVEKVLQHIEKEKGQLYLPVIQPGGKSKIHKFLFAGSITSVKLFHKIGRPISMGPIIVIAKTLFDQIGGFDEKIAIAEDHNLIIKAYKKGVKAKFIEDVNCYFSMRRFDSEGTWNIVWQYIRYTGITLVKGGVLKPISKYEQGGHVYKVPAQK